MTTDCFDKSGLRCLGCGYDLRGGADDRCSECGRFYDRSNPSTFLCDTDRFHTRANRYSRKAGFAFFVLELTLLSAVVLTRLLAPLYSFPVDALACLGVPCVTLVAVLALALSGSPPGAIRKRELRTVGMAILVIPAFLVVWWPTTTALERWRDAMTIRRIERLVSEANAFQVERGRPPKDIVELCNSCGIRRPSDPWGEPIDLVGDETHYFIRAEHMDFLTWYQYIYDSKQPNAGVVVHVD